MSFKKVLQGTLGPVPLVRDERDQLWPIKTVKTIPHPVTDAQKFHDAFPGSDFFLTYPTCLVRQIELIGSGMQITDPDSIRTDKETI
jgi:hypothetical protein